MVIDILAHSNKQLVQPTHYFSNIVSEHCVCMQMQLAKSLSMYVKSGDGKFDYVRMMETVAHEEAWRDLFKPFQDFQ